MKRATEWKQSLDLKQALRNLAKDFKGDWHKDPWGWPELPYLVSSQADLLNAWFDEPRAHSPARIDVPKDNWGRRPAVVLDPIDKLAYQALVDFCSVRLIGSLSANAYGWRLTRTNPMNGKYALEKHEWAGYQEHICTLADHSDAALTTDVVSCFASIGIERMSDEIEQRTRRAQPGDAISSFLTDFQKTPTRSGLPQRSRASSVLANLFLSVLDEVLEAGTKAIPRRVSYRLHRLGKSAWVRWMDDIWVFGDSSQLRRLQFQLDTVANEAGLHLNSGKTKLFEGESMRAHVYEMEHSAIDSAMKVEGRNQQLEALIDRILDGADHAARTEVKFALSRMKHQEVTHRSAELLEAADRLPHCADAFAAYARATLDVKDREAWFRARLRSPWASSFQWSLANYAGVLDSDDAPKKATLDCLSELAVDRNTQLPLLAVAVQRLAAWAPKDAKVVIAERISDENDPHSRRALCYAGLAAGHTARTIRKWLSGHERNEISLAMMDEANFKPLRVDATYAAGGPGLLELN